MIEVKSDFSGGLNLDDALYNVPRNSYIDALNITRDAIEGSNDKALTNIVGNQLINYNYPSYPSLVTITPNSSIVGTTITQNIVYSGTTYVAPGFAFYITLYRISTSTQFTAATYISVQGDTINTVVSGLVASLTAGAYSGITGITSSVTATTATIQFVFQTNQYNFISATVARVASYGTRVCIGAYPNTVRNTIIYFVWNSVGYHSIMQYNNVEREISPIFTNLVDSGNVDILGFTEHDKITSVNVFNRNIEEGEGDILYFLDSLGRPTQMDILKFSQAVNEYKPVTRDIINVAKCPPLSPPTCTYGNDTTKRTNSLRNRLFRFKYRYVYDSNQKSVCSPISEVSLPKNILQDTYTNVITNNNKISLSFNTGNKDVREVQVLMSYVNKTNDWSDFSLVESINKNTFSFLNISQKTYRLSGSGKASFRNVVFNFDGYVVPGININIKISYFNFPSPPAYITLANYTTIAGDTLSSIISTVYSQMATHTSGTDLTFSLVGNNSIGMTYNTGAGYIYNSNYTVITYPSNLSIDNFNYAYSFYNDGTYPTIDVNESIQLFDYVPDLANAQEMPNGNVLMYGGITEGYDRALTPNVSNTVLTKLVSNVPVGNLAISFTQQDGASGGRPGFWEVFLYFSGVPVTGTVITLIGTQGTICTYTTVAADADLNVLIDNLITRIRTTAPAWVNQVNIWDDPFSMNIELSLGTFSSAQIVPPSSDADYSSIPTFLFSTERRLGIAYFDKNGKTNGILYNDRVVFPRYTENASHVLQIPYINTKIYHQPPEWAYSYNFYLTKENTQFLYWETLAVKEDTDYYYYNITNLSNYIKYVPSVTNVLSYTFQDGDRLRLIKNKSSLTVYDDTYDAEILGQVTDPTGLPAGIYIKTRKFAPFNGIVDFLTYNYIIQIYRPGQQSANSLNEVYYEFGQQYFIGDSGLSTRYHMGMVTNQIPGNNIPAEFNFYGGDVYFRYRKYAYTTSGGTATGTLAVLDRNFVDTYISAVNSIDGRASVVDINAKRAYYSTLVRFSEAYQANTNINGTNRFYPNNFDEYDYSYGDIMRFKVRDRFVRVFQKLKVGQVPLYHQILKEQNKESLVVSDRLLNPIQYYVGDVGIGENAESLASFNFADYFTSNIKGVICRVSNDGIKFLSIDHKIDSWAWKAISQRTGNYKIYGAFDTILQQYIIALEATNTDEAQTLMFDEGDNTFDTFLSYNPEMMATLGVLLVTFKNGQLYTHDSTEYNTFYGSQYDSRITVVFNEAPIDKKTFLAIGEVASQVWDVPQFQTDINSDEMTKMTSNLIYTDFAQLEGSFEAVILRDINSLGGLIEGDTMKGKILTATFRAKNPASLVSLNLLSLKYINSPLNNR